MDKERILDHLPEAQHSWVRRKLHGAWAQADVGHARRDLEALARASQRKHPGVAASLREGLEETLTITKLAIDGALLKTVFSTSWGLETEPRPPLTSLRCRASPNSARNTDSSFTDEHATEPATTEDISNQNHSRGTQGQAPGTAPT